MQTVFIFHGYNGTPAEHWLGWLKESLRKTGVNSFAPQFPHADNPKRTAWLETLFAKKDLINNQSIFVGHSLGVPFSLMAIEQLEKPIKAAFLVAGFYNRLENPDFDPMITRFLKPNLDWKKVKKNCANFIVLHSNDDPYVPLRKGEELVEKLSAKYIFIPDGGHFNSKSGYNEFPKLLDELGTFLAN